MRGFFFSTLKNACSFSPPIQMGLESWNLIYRSSRAHINVSFEDFQFFRPIAPPLPLTSHLHLQNVVLQSFFRVLNLFLVQFPSKLCQEGEIWYVDFVVDIDVYSEGSTLQIHCVPLRLEMWFIGRFISFFACIPRITLLQIKLRSWNLVDMYI